MAKGKCSDRIIEQWKSATVVEHTDKIQQLYKKWIVVCVAFVAGGAGMMTATSNPKGVAFGLFLAITGMINIAVMKLWAHTKLSMLRVVYEPQKQNQAHSG